MGATGPCGPCSEIHYDRIGNRDAAAFVNADLPDVIEIWNIVFIQFNRETDGSLRELPSKHVDTGMGFERLSSILQGKTSNYDTDIFTPIFDEIQKFAGCRAYQGLVGKDDKDLTDMAYRVVADHIRTLTFAVTDGAVPSNDGRGYVLRRILRRAVRYGQEILHAPSGFFSKLVDVVVANFSSSFPELAIKKEYVRTILMEEEDSFNRTLDLGVKHFKKVVVGMESSGVKVVPAKDAHILFSSMGFPLDLTELMAAELGYTVDSKGFEELMENDRKISEAAEMARKGDSSKDLTLVAEQTSWLQEKNILPTDSSMKYTWNIAPTVTISAIFGGRGNNNDAGFLTNASSSDGSIGLIFDLTSFYYESGGQIFDTGVVEGAGFRFNVTNCQTYAGYVVHVGQLTADSKSITVGDAAIMKVDYERRGFIAPNHTMTHVLNYALREVLIGKNSDNNLTVNLCEQKGSLVDAERLRFDFSWTSAMSPEQIAQVESIVNQQIKSELPVHAEVVPLSSAVEIKSLRKVFGERYPDPVRVLSVGQAVEKLLADPTNNDWSNYSVEFCGGTHLTNTNQAEEFVITEESGIAKGIRRISGLTRDLAKEARQRGAVLLSRLTAMESMEGGSELSNLHKSIKLEVGITWKLFLKDLRILNLFCGFRWIRLLFRW